MVVERSLHGHTAIYYAFAYHKPFYLISFDIAFWDLFHKWQFPVTTDDYWVIFFYTYQSWFDAEPNLAELWIEL